MSSGTRWTPHTEKALRIMLHTTDVNPASDQGQYSTIFQHMEHLAVASTNTDIKGRALHITKKMKNVEFVTFAHFLLDVLGYISTLSLTFQSNKTLLTTATSGIKNCIDNLEALKLRVKPAKVFGRSICTEA